MYGKVDVIIGLFLSRWVYGRTPFGVNANIMIYQKVPRHLIICYSFVLEVVCFFRRKQKLKNFRKEKFVV